MIDPYQTDHNKMDNKKAANTHGCKQVYTYNKASDENYVHNEVFANNQNSIVSHTRVDLVRVYISANR